MPGDVVYLVRDLLFVSKIRSAAEQLGVEVRGAPSPEALVAAARGARLVIVDLRLPESLRALVLLRDDAGAAGVPSVGFVDHERVDLMEQARGLGLDRALAKGAFANELPRLLAP